MFGIASRSNPSARTVSRQTSTERSFVYVDSSGDRRRSQRDVRAGRQRRRAPGRASARTSARAAARTPRRRRPPRGAARPRARGARSPSRPRCGRPASCSPESSASRSLAGDEELAALLVEAADRAPRQLAELFALRVVGRARQAAPAADRSGSSSPSNVSRAARIAFSSASSLLGELGLDEPALARLAQAVEPLALVTLGRLPPPRGAPRAAAA